MAAKRRKWKENLFQECKTESTPKKPKINIIEDQVFKEHNGQLVLIKHLVKSSIKETNKSESECIENQPPVGMNIVSTPHQKPIKVKNLTPTFRKPDKYIKESAKVMQDISPKSDNVCDTSTADSELNTIVYQENNILSNCSLDGLENELNFKENNSICFDEFKNNDVIINTNKEQETQCMPKNDVAIEVNPTHKNVVQSITPDWAQHTICTVEVTIEAYHENSDHSIVSRESVKNMSANLKTTGSNVTSTSILDAADEIERASDSEVLQSPEPKQKIFRRSKRKLTFNKSYLDFVDGDPDTALFNEAFPSEESEISVLEQSSSNSSTDSARQKKKIRKKTQKKKKTKNTVRIETAHELPLEKPPSKTKLKKKNQKNKQKGEKYVNTKGETIDSKCIKPNPCVGVNCGNNCENISEERRNSIFNHFWGLASYQRRKDWICQCAIRRSVKRASKTAATNRSQSFEYFINEGEGRRKVCQKFIIATLDVTQRFILYTLDSMIDGFSQEDKRGSAGGHNKTSESVIIEAREFVLSLPLVPSHHCRKDSGRLYLPEEFKNITNLYRIYQNELKNKKTMSYKIFVSWFRETFNIGFHIPKKDKCLICFNGKSYDVKTKEEMEKYINHINEKEESYNRFIFHQNINKMDSKTICACFDLQKVLNTPYGENMNFYYSRKLAVYNFTIYESCSQLGICNVWTEVDAKRGANEIATCLLDYIKDVDKRGNVTHLILYCDSCFGQNKNKTILAMIHYALSTCINVEIIQINFLTPGHTYMPVDSMHATIENNVKKSTVWAPSQWPTIIEFSRKNPGPYTVNVLTGRDFLGFDDLVDNTFTKNQKLQISKIRSVTFRKNMIDKIIVKHSMLTTAESIEVQIKPVNRSLNPVATLYPSKLPISKQKYSDLKKLVDKGVIPQRFSKEYLDLKCSAKVKDCLPDTDEEDDFTGDC